MSNTWLLENFNLIKTLIDENRFPNCLIISGNKAIGKRYLAADISKYYLKINPGISLSDDANYKLIKPEDGSKVIKVEQVRELLEKIYLKTDKRIVCIHDAEKMNLSTSNSLLKIIEEPPSGTKFIITTSKISSIIPTIISRSMILKCDNPGSKDINSYINSLESLDVDNYHFLSNLERKKINNSKHEDTLLFIDDFFFDIENVINSEENMINFSKKFSSYNIEQIINLILFYVVKFQKEKIIKHESEKETDNNHVINNYNYEKLNFIYDKLLNIKKNIGIIQNNETILFSICILFKKLAKVS